MGSKHIEVDHVARIEGHGDILIDIDGDTVTRCEFKVTEPARLFESMVRGRYFDESPYISSRVCGICSASHTVTDILAIEDAFGIEVTDRTRALRELLVYGSYLQNHATHLFVFAAPDFVGHKSVFPLAASNKELFDNALGLKALGNKLCNCVGGRSIHPITAVVGGFTSEPSREDLLSLADALDSALPFACSCVDLFDDFGSVAIETQGDFLAMASDENSCDYPVIGSRTANFVFGDDGEGYKFDVSNYRLEVEEYTIGHSAAFLAKASRTKKPYFTSALARINANWDGLCEQARFAAAKAGLRPPEKNPFANNIAQAVELVDSLVRCAGICRALANDEYSGSSEVVPYEVRAGHGIGFTEAPRGSLFHELDIDENGCIVSANIIPPTSQNIANLESDMRLLANELCKQGFVKDEIQLEVEKLVRAYDPCLSCSVH